MLWIHSCACAIFLLALAGCDDSKTRPTNDAGTNTNEITDATGDGEDAGDAIPFEIELVESAAAASGQRAAYAWVANPPIQDGAWIPTLTAGDCVYNMPQEPAFCDPACNPGQVCRPDGTCAPPVSRVSAGAITVSGLRVGLTLRPVAPYLYYEPVWNPEPADGDLFEPGALVTAAAEGAGLPAFTVSSRGVDSMETALPCPAALVSGSGLDIAWTPAVETCPDGAESRIRFILQSGNHGIQFSSIVCTLPDTGFLHVDAALLDAFLADFHPVTLWVLRRVCEGRTRAGNADVRLRNISQSSCYQ